MSHVTLLYTCNRLDTMFSALKLHNFSIKAGDFFQLSTPAWFWSSGISFSVIKVCYRTSCISLKFLRSDCSSRHNFDMIVSISSNNNSSNTMLGSERSDRYLLISGLGLATSAWSRTSKISLYFSKHLLHAEPSDSHLVTTALTKWVLAYHVLSEFQSGSSDLKHYNETISTVLVATCQVLPAKETDQWDVWNKETICGTCNWHTCYEEICDEFFFEGFKFLPTLNLSNLSNKIYFFEGLFLVPSRFSLARQEEWLTLYMKLLTRPDILSQIPSHPLCSNLRIYPSSLF